MTLIQKTHTSCKDCIFAKYNKITQIGCKLFEIERFKRYNKEVLECYDEEKEFYVINQTKCLRKRTSDWTFTNKSLNKQIAQINKEIEINVHCIVFANDDIEALKDTIDSIYHQRIKPTYITVIRKYNCKILPSTLAYLFKEHYSSIPWRIQNTLIDAPDEQLIDLVVPFVKSQFYCIFQAGFEIPDTFLSDINNKLHLEFYHIIMLLPNSSNNGLFVANFVHTGLGGNNHKPLKQKLEEDKCPYLIPVYKITRFPK